jgi:hypothetical protein
MKYSLCDGGVGAFAVLSLLDETGTLASTGRFRKDEQGVG